MVPGKDADGAERVCEEQQTCKVEEVKKPVRKAVDVRVVASRVKSLVVEVKTSKEWYRSVLPIEAVRRLPGATVGTAFEDDLAAGRYGEDWAKMVDARDFPNRLADELRKQGIFSKEDLRKKLELARVAVMSAHGRTLADLLSKE